MFFWLGHFLVLLQFYCNSYWLFIYPEANFCLNRTMILLREQLIPALLLSLSLAQLFATTRTVAIPGPSFPGLNSPFLLWNLTPKLRDKETETTAYLHSGLFLPRNLCDTLVSSLLNWLSFYLWISDCSLTSLFSCLVRSDSLWPHGLKHTRLPCPSLSLSLLKLTSIVSVMPFNQLILCRPLLLLPSIFPSINVFSDKSALRIRWPKYRRFSFSISPSNEYLGMISFRIDRLTSLKSKGLSRVFSNTTVQKHQFFGAQSSLWSNCHNHI